MVSFFLSSVSDAEKSIIRQTGELREQCYKAYKDGIAFATITMKGFTNTV